ncbi:MAG: VCBS repeat-containing protein, partial [Chloroflexi bacterium]|nr:VCBS repeat-containing protein [Chloroflexota bacterium]
FDFNGDGIQEIVYNDETNLRVMDGNTNPPTNLATFANTSPTWFEHPVIADVDDDGEAEIVAVGSGQVHVFESALDPWQPARTMWNQRGYYVVNVNDDLTIPAGQQATTVELSAGSGQHALNRYNAQFSPASLILNGGCIDLGDAPDPTYPTLAASNGARHGTEDGLLFLGAGVDNDNDGQPDASAAGDDNDAQGNDDDGVVFVSALLLGQQVDVDVTASAAGQLDAWVDFDGNGSWADAGEQIFNVAVAAGVNHLHFTPPGGSTTDPTFARFRLSTAGGLSYDGFAEDGEVEDYGLQFTLPSAVTLASVGIAADSNAAPVILGLMFVLGIVGAGAAWRVSRRR